MTKFRWFIAAIIVAIVAVSCKKDTPVVWEQLVVSYNEPGVIIDIRYPYRFGGTEQISSKINDVIEDRLLYAMFADQFETGISIDSTISLLIESKNNDPVLNRMTYDVRSTSEVYESEELISVELDTYVYTGGANGTAQVVLLNLDPKTSQTIAVEDIIVLDDDLLALVRTEFCKERDISIDQSADATGLFVKPSELPFSEQIGFNKTGVIFFYNLYEVAPRSGGTTKVEIPYHLVTKLAY